LLYVLLAVYFFQFYRYQINPDAVSYISIAQKYLSGDFSLAVNGYWSPLFSWLMIPLLLMGIEPLIAAKIMILTVGAFTVWGVGILASKLRIEKEIRIVIVIFSAPLILGYAFHSTTPDLLTVCTLIYYLTFALHKDYPKKKHTALWAGVFGALAYLSKAYNFAFFLAHFILLNFTLFLIKDTDSKKRKRIANSFVKGILTFFVISGIWIFSISQKYDKFTIGTSGKYNYSVIGPQSKGHPTHYRGFLPPHDEKSISAWDDPSYFIVKGWSPFSSRENFKHQLDIIRKNIEAYLSSYSICLISVVFALFYILKSLKKGYSKDINEFFIICAIFIYPIGYFLIIIEQRLIRILSVLTILIGGYILTNLFRTKFFNKLVKNVTLIFFALSILYSSVAFFKNPRYRYRERGIYELSNVLRKYNIKGKVASSKQSWPLALYLAHYLKFKYYGETKAEAEADEDLLKNDLEKYDIDYFIIRDRENDVFMKDYEEVTKKERPGIKVYNLKKRRK